jgi:hypothetical protein
MYQFLLVVHIAGGVLSLSAPLGALAAAKGTHWHVLAGRVFVLGMLVIFVTTLPMTMLKPNAFLFGVAFVSFYLALTGWSRARHRAAAPVLTDWLSAWFMVLGALIISLWAFPLARAGDSKGGGLLAFAAVGATLAVIDLSAFRAHRYQGQVRIVAHLSRMLAGYGAALAAFTVTALKVRTSPAFLAFLLPALIIAPVSWYWRARIRRQTSTDSPAGV